MSGCFDFLKCLLCCADELDCLPTSSNYTRARFVDCSYEERLIADSRYASSPNPSLSPSPSRSHLPTSTSTSTSTSFRGHYYNSIDSVAPPKSSYTPPKSTTPPLHSLVAPPNSSYTPPKSTTPPLHSPVGPPKSSYTPPKSTTPPPPIITLGRYLSSKPRSTQTIEIESSSSSPKKPPQGPQPLPQLTSSNLSPNPSSHKPPPSSSKPSASPSSSTSTSFLGDQYCCRDFGNYILHFPVAPPKLSCTQPQSTTPPSPPTNSFNSSSSSSEPRPTLLSTVKPSSPSPKKQPQPLPQLTSSTPKPNPSSQKPPPSKPSSSSSSSSPKVTPVYRSILTPVAASNVTGQRQPDGKKTAYVCVEEDSIPTFMIPEDIQALIKQGIVPKVLNRPLSSTTYKDYFGALLYFEDFYLEKWGDFHSDDPFILKGVTLKLDESAIYKNRKKEDKTFVAFDLDSVPEKLPYLLSRDLVFARPADTSTAEPFKGIIFRVVRSTRVLVEFEDRFHSYHRSSKPYDISFSFNRVCLKRAHQAVKAASETLIQNFLFPCDSRASIPNAALLSTTCHKLDPDQRSAVAHILRIKGSPPYVVTGPRCVPEGKFESLPKPSKTGVVVSEAVHQLCQKSPEYRILICAPTNCCCDVLMRSLVEVIPESTMFRANAAFREKEEVPEDIFRSSLYQEKQSCFSCPPVEKLRKYRVIFSTFMSAFRLHDKGIAAGHFSHIFLVDASSAIEPETLVPLTNFADKTTSVIVTGRPGHSPHWIRSDIARTKGLKISYFERLCRLRPYRIPDPMFITELDLSSDYQTRTF